MTLEIFTTPAEVHADIASLKAEHASIADQIFALEQQSTDYKAVLANPDAGAERMGTLALLRERQRSIDIALDAAKQALADAEANQLRVKLTEQRNGIKALIFARDEAGREASKAIDQLADAVAKLAHSSKALLGAINSGANGILTDKGWVVLDGAAHLNDPQAVQHWVQLSMMRRLGGFWVYDRAPVFGSPPDIADSVEEISRNVLREWDAANRTQQHSVIAHDPVERAEPGAATVTVTAFDEDPTQEELEAIAAMEPAEAVKAMRPFALSKWARDNGLTEQLTKGN